jgi:hypothetical protein
MGVFDVVNFIRAEVVNFGLAPRIAAYLSRISDYLPRFLTDAEQLEPAQRWPAMLRQICYQFCCGTGPLQGKIRPLAVG